MSMKKFFKKIVSPVFNNAFTRQERTFYLLATVALTAFACAIAVTAVLHFSPMQVAVRIAIWLLFFLLALFSLKLHKTKFAIYFSATFLTFVLLPFNFFSGGGIRGGCAIWNLFGLICVLYLVESNFKFVLLFGNIFIFAACCVVERFRPDMLAQFSAETLFAKSLISVYIVSVIVFLLILFQNRIYRTENETSLKQKKEIEELSQAQSRFFSSMSHEIRTPVNTIVGLNELIQRNAISQEVAEDSARVQSAGKMLLSLINDILDISKMEAGKMEIIPAPYDTGALLSDLVNMMWFPAKEKGLEFHLSIGDDIPARLVGDEARVKQVMVNLLNNAVKYTEKGNVTLSVQCEKSAKEGMVDMVYSVADTGIGIRQENIPHLFEVFKRVDIERTKSIEGTGLGLSIVQQLLDLMGGTVAVNSVYTQGSTFIVRIPQEPQGDETVDSDAIKAKHRSGKEVGRILDFTAPSAHVLVVDDNDSNRLVAQKLLRETCAQIDGAASGKECLQKTRETRYDVIFMDYLMPDMDGVECLREIRKQEEGFNANTPVVALTAEDSPDAQALYVREGFDGILIKPITGREIETEFLRHLPSERIKVGSIEKIHERYETPFVPAEHKMPLMIATDVSSDIPKELLRHFNITLLPVEIKTDSGVFIDGEEIDQDGLMHYLERGGKTVASVDQTLKSYLTVFPQWISRAQQVIYISTSSKIVSSFPAACMAARSFDSISVFDSLQTSAGLGLLVLRAAELAAEGAAPETIFEELEEMRPRVHLSCVISDTSYVLTAGRVQKFVCRVCDSLLLHPVLSVSKGRLKLASLEFGSSASYWKSYIGWALREPKTIDKSIVIVMYAGVEAHRLAEIEAEINRLVEFEHVYFQKVAASVFANCGPGTFGIAFMRNGKVWS